MEKKYDIFISYRKEKSVYADLVKQYLLAHGYEKERVFLDKHNIHAEQFDKKLESAIQDSQCFLLIVSKECFVSRQSDENDDWFLKEIQVAIDNHVLIVPLLFDGIKSLEDSGTKEHLKDNFSLEDYELLVKQQAVRYDNDYSESALEHLMNDFLPLPTVSEPAESRGWRYMKMAAGIVGAIGCLVLLYFCIFGVAFGITYLHEKPTDTPQEELRNHTFILGQTVSYFHGNTQAAYSIEKDSVLYVNSKVSVAPTISISAFWSASAISPAFSKYITKMARKGGNPKERIVMMVTGFVAVMFGYSQGEQFALDYCEGQRYLMMRDALWDKENWKAIIETD